MYMWTSPEAMSAAYQPASIAGSTQRLADMASQPMSAANMQARANRAMRIIINLRLPLRQPLLAFGVANRKPRIPAGARYDSLTSEARRRQVPRPPRFYGLRSHRSCTSRGGRASRLDETSPTGKGGRLGPSV